MSKLKRLLCYESQHQSQSNEKSLVQFDYEKAVSNYLGTQSTFNPWVWTPGRVHLNPNPAAGSGGGCSGAATSEASGELMHPWGIALHGGLLYVTDVGGERSTAGLPGRVR